MGVVLAYLLCIVNILFARLVGIEIRNCGQQYKQVPPWQVQLADLQRPVNNWPQRRKKKNKDMNMSAASKKVFTSGKKT